MITSLGIFLELEILQTKVVEKIEIYYAVYDVMWKNTVKPNRPNIILHKKIRFACRVKNKDTHS
jgi:hypothetical protein